jgi:hypothetical protein
MINFGKKRDGNKKNNRRFHLTKILEVKKWHQLKVIYTELHAN